MMIADIISNSKTPIHTIASGMTYSGGFLILISGHKRFATKHSSIMWHQVSSTLYGKLDGLYEDYDMVRTFQNNIDNFILSKTNIERSDLDGVYKRKKDWYMSPDEALVFGIIDEVIQ